MTPTQFKRLRGDYSINELSDMIGITPRTIRRYEDGTHDIGKPVQLLMSYVGMVIFDNADEVIADAIGERDES
tara:strand:- start:4608 stop:4826 length:219 start_codon:yes stop_codon:yes gene_type:complete